MAMTQYTVRNNHLALVVHQNGTEDITGLPSPQKNGTQDIKSFAQ